MARLLALLGMVATAQCSSNMTLSGYVCPTCPSTPDPGSLLKNLPKVYNVVNFAFVGWNASGGIVNQFDAPSKSFKLTAEVVKQLQSEGRTVMLSIGGGAGGVITGDEPATFSSNMANGLIAYSKSYGFDGIDFDIEHRSGDLMKCATVINNVLKMLKQKKPSIKISFAPQMVNLDPEVNTISAGFNELAPVIGPSLSLIDWVQPQMYNSWPGVETLAYAQRYTSELLKGYTVSDVVVPPMPPQKLLLGYPASSNGAGSGYLPPCEVVAMVRSMHQPILGLMTWDIGWDQKDGWKFANCVAQK
eukprot:TRINITY_DN11771_c0_g1_i1.p1 TRINITY_DN11771_c0_g1~~TRINITY_DN11771_c0_g1_i1.p1  ORF type:complete len:303 (+),score=68.23 TRINITY_DN11771_c0_g1_i1:86-994(+)